MATTPKSLQDILGFISRNNNTADISKHHLAEADFSAVGYQKVTDAKTHGITNKSGEFIGANRSKGVDVEALRERIKQAEEHLKDMPDSAHAKKQLETAKRELERRAEHIYRDAGKAHALNAEAIEKAERDAEKVIKQLEKHHDSAAKALAAEVNALDATHTHVLVNTKTGLLEGSAAAATKLTGTADKVVMSRADYLNQSEKALYENFNTARQQVSAQLKDFRADRIEVMNDLKKSAAAIEKETGIAHASYFEQAAAKLGGTEGQAAEKVAETGMKLGKLKLGFNPETAVAAVSVGAMIDGAKRLISGFKGGVNEKGEQTPPDTSQQVIGGVEAGAGVIALHRLVTRGGLFKAAAHLG